MAARTEIPIVVLNPDSPFNPINNAPVVFYLRNADGTRGAAATVYNSGDPSDLTTLANPGIVTDTSGRVTGWLPRGRYEAVVTVAGHPDYSEFLDSMPGGDGDLDTAALADGSITNAKLASGAVTAGKITAGTITNTEISNTAGIGYGKLSLTGSVVNADISASAAIAHSKLANTTAGFLLLGNGSGVITGTALSGDATISSGGALTIANNAVTTGKIADGNVTTAKILDGNVTAAKIADGSITGGTAGAGVKIAAGTITNANVSNSAAIAYAKLALAGSVVNADIASGAAIAYSKLSLTGSVVNADIGNSAAIAYSKLSLAGSIVNADIASGAAIAYSKLALTGAILNADLAGSIAHSKLATTTPGYVLMGAPTTGVVTATQLHGDISVAADGTVTVASVSGSSVGPNSIGPAQLTRVAAGKILVTQGTGVDSSYVTPSGDVTIDSTGVTTIGAGAVSANKLASDAVTTIKILDANITNAKIASNTITPAKLARDTAGTVLLAKGAGADTAFTALSGDATIDSSGVVAISSGVIVNADISASAAIAHSKLANATAGQVLLGNGTGVITATTLSGDVTINSSGVTAIKSGVALAGVPTAATAAVDTNTTQLATTAFVLGQAGNTVSSLGRFNSGVGTSTKFSRADHTHANPTCHYAHPPVGDVVQGDTATANRLYVVAVDVRNGNTATGVRIRVGGTIAGQCKAGLFDEAGGRVATATVNTAAFGNNGDALDILFDSAVNVDAGVYYMAVTFSSSSMTYKATKYNSWGVQLSQGSHTIPASLVGNTSMTPSNALTPCMTLILVG